MKNQQSGMAKIRFKKPGVFLIAVVLFLIFYSVIISLLPSECDPAVIITDGFSEIPENMRSKRNIYFLETHNSSDHELMARAACSIESAALMNPDRNIFVLFLSPTKYTRVKNWSQFRGIFNYKNIHLRFFNTEDFVKDTIIEDWINKGLLSSSWYQVAHTSDVLRYALLHKFSGIYLDLDVIVRKSLDEIEFENFACFENDGEVVNNAIIKIGDDNGRELGKMLLNEVISHFDGSDWSINGPKLLTRVLKRYCDVTDFSITHGCKNFKILPQELCYPIPWQNWEEYFSERYSQKAMSLVERSFFAHFWNKKSEGRRLDKRSNAAFNQLASSYCPHVHESNVLI